MELRGTDRVACSRQANDFPASLDRAYRARFIADDAGGAAAAGRGALVDSAVRRSRHRDLRRSLVPDPASGLAFPSMRTGGAAGRLAAFRSTNGAAP